MPVKQNRKSAETDHISSSAGFFTDIELPHMYAAVLIRSPISGGTIRSITMHSPPDNYFLITSKDIPGSNTINVLDEQVHVLAGERVSYKGEPIAVLCGPDEKTLHQLAEKLDIRFTANFFDEKKEESFHENQILSRRIVRYGESDSAFVKSRIKIENEYTAQIQYASLNEPIGAAAYFSGKTLTLYTPTQWPYHVRKTVSSVLNIDCGSITIQKTISNDSSTHKIWYNSILCALTALASSICGRPVKLVLSRKEQKKYIDRITQVLFKFRTGIDNAGRITSLNVSIRLDAGAYSPFASDILDRLVLAAAGIYKPDTMCIEGYAVKSRTPPMSADIQLADSCSFFAVENHLQQIAQTVHIDPIEIRLKNAEEPSTTAELPFPFTFQTGSLQNVLREAADRSDFNRKYTSYFLNAMSREVFESSVPVRGIGIAAAFEGSGFYGSSMNASNLSIEVSMEIDSSVIIHAYTPSKSIQVIWKKLAAKILGIDQETVSVRSEFSFTDEPLLPQMVTDNISIMTQLLKKACSDIQKLRFRQPLPIKIKRSLNPSRKKIWDPKLFCGTPFHSVSMAAAVVELEIDPWTYTDKIKNIWMSVDAGEILDKKQAEITLKKAVQHVLPSIRDKGYADLPRIHLSFVQGSGEPKQIGDLVYNVIPAAYINALSTALHKTVPSIPVSSDSLFSVLYAEDEKADDETDRKIINETDSDN